MVTQVVKTKVQYTDRRYKENLIFLHKNNSKEDTIAQTIEELAELQQALAKALLNKPNVSNIFEELADVQNMVKQIGILFDFDYEEFRAECIKRTQRAVHRIEATK